MSGPFNGKKTEEQQSNLLKHAPDNAYTVTPLPYKPPEPIMKQRQGAQVFHHASIQLVPNTCYEIYNDAKTVYTKDKKYIYQTKAPIYVGSFVDKKDTFYLFKDNLGNEINIDCSNNNQNIYFRPCPITRAGTIRRKKSRRRRKTNRRAKRANRE